MVLALGLGLPHRRDPVEVAISGHLCAEKLTAKGWRGAIAQRWWQRPAIARRRVSQLASQLPHNRPKLDGANDMMMYMFTLPQVKLPDPLKTSLDQVVLCATQLPKRDMGSFSLGMPSLGTSLGETRTRNAGQGAPEETR